MKRKVHCAVVALDETFTASVFGLLELVQACTRLQLGLPELEPCEITTEILSPTVSHSCPPRATGCPSMLA